MNHITLEDRGFRVIVVADSVNEWGDRLTTEVWRYPRFIHSEVMTHRDFSRNAASSRAIPVKKIIDQVRNDPAMPIFWGKNQPGMQAAEELDNEVNDFYLAEDPTVHFTQKQAARFQWLRARDEAVKRVEAMMALGLHKQIANRILEPWMWMTAIVSATNWGNFYHLRRAADTQPEFKLLADLSFEAKQRSTPKLLKEGEWHLPFIRGDEWSLATQTLQMLSVARCARVSYLLHSGESPIHDKDIQLHDRLKINGHMSPFEHQATPMSGRYGNFTGWLQYRKTMPNEYCAKYQP